MDPTRASEALNPDDLAPAAPTSVEEFRARLTDVLDDLPRRLRQCADYIAANTDRIAVSTVAELAAGADVPPYPDALLPDPRFFGLFRNAAPVP